MERARRGFFTLLTFINSTLITVQILALPVSVRTVQRLAWAEDLVSSPVRVGRVTDRTLGYLYNVNQDEQRLDAYSDRERAHLRDVRRRFWQARLVLAAGLFLAAAGIRLGWWQGIHFVALMKNILTINFLIGTAVIFAFSAFFEVFHRLLFAPGSYLFAETDLLIRLFPPRFWWLMFVLLVSLNSVPVVAARMLGRLTRRTRFNRVAVRRGVKDEQY